MKKLMTTEGLSRRNFLGGAALGLGALAVGSLAGCSPKTADGGNDSTSSSSSAADVAWDNEYDVVVCGGGGGGLTAAYSALENGAEKVIVLEKGAQCGGTTALAEGAVQAAGTKWQKAKGIEDTPDLLFNYWKTDSEDLVDEELIRCMADNAADNVEWMAESFGIDFANVFGAYTTPYLAEKDLKDRIHLIADATDLTKTGGAVWTTNAKKAVEAKGGEVTTNAEVTELIMGEKGVAGVKTKDGKTYKANKGVVMAMAGIEHNEDLAKRYNPQHYWDLKTQNVLTAPTDTGDGIVMGMAVGAQTIFHGCVDLLLQTWSYTNNQNPEIPYILVNMRGNRFVREDTTYAFHCRAIFNAAMQEGGAAGATYMIMDSKMTTSDKVCAWSDNAKDGAAAREAALKDGTLVEADSLEALAEAIGVPANNLTGTVTTWNTDCVAETDNLFGRVKQLSVLDTAPFYAWKTQNSNIGAIGGLRINTDAAILNEAGEPIAHLFGAGVNTAGWIGPYYPGSGTCLQGTLNWGRIAGKSAATA